LDADFRRFSGFKFFLKIFLIFYINKKAFSAVICVYLRPIKKGLK